MTRPLSIWLAVFACVLPLGAACSGDDDGGDGLRAELSPEELMDPETCKDCHPKHYREWKSSMHAYASDDPVFIAMNQRGQRETNGELGTFCVNCHAPMGVVENVVTDGSELLEENYPDHLKGVTCYFCHNVVGVDQNHNNGLVIARDSVMRGGITDPVQPGVHRAEFSEFYDRNNPQSSLMCGSCHDIITPKGVELERTFREYKDSVFGSGGGFDSCPGCHMDARDGVAAEVEDLDVPSRSIHEHLWAAVDLALTDWPDREAQEKAVLFQLANGSRTFELRPDPTGRFEVLLETNAGHNQPSGASQDRRMWIEFVAYDEDDNVIFESGSIADDEPVFKSEDDPDYDPHLWAFRDTLFGDDGEEVHMFWEAADVESYVLPYTKDLSRPHTLMRSYQVPTLPARVTVRAFMRPMGFDVLQNLVDSGDLDPAILGEMKTLPMYGMYMEWHQEDGFAAYKKLEPRPIEAKDYVCLFDPDAPLCSR